MKTHDIAKSISHFIKISTHLLFLLLFSFNGNAQHEVMHFMNAVPQSARSNPAFFPEYGGHFAFLLPNIEFSFTHSGFRYSDLVVRKPNDSLFLDVNNAVATMADINHLRSSFSYEPLSFGFRVNNNYFSLSAAPRMKLLASYPKELLVLLTQGNAGFIGQTVNIGNADLAGNAWNEIAFGYARQFSEKLTAGVRLKYLTGISSAKIERAVINLHTDAQMYHLSLQSDILTYSSVPGEENYNFLKNTGFAVDFGISYKPIYRLTLQAGLTDLGTISWNTNTLNYRSNENSNFTFEGLDLNEFFANENGDDNGFERLGDSLMVIFEPTEFKEAFQTNIGSRVYFSATYELPSKGSAGIFFQHESLGRSSFPSLGLIYHHPVGNVLDVAVSYSMHGHNMNAVGLGINLNLGPMQFYAVTGNVISAFLPQHARMASIQLGFNFLLDRDRKEKAAGYQEDSDTVE